MFQSFVHYKQNLFCLQSIWVETHLKTQANQTKIVCGEMHLGKTCFYRLTVARHIFLSTKNVIFYYVYLNFVTSKNWL